MTTPTTYQNDTLTPEQQPAFSYRDLIGRFASKLKSIKNKQKQFVFYPHLTEKKYESYLNELEQPEKYKGSHVFVEESLKNELSKDYWNAAPYLQDKDLHKELSSLPGLDHNASPIRTSISTISDFIKSNKEQLVSIRTKNGEVFIFDKDTKKPVISFFRNGQYRPHFVTSDPLESSSGLNKQGYWVDYQGKSPSVYADMINSFLPRVFDIKSADDFDTQLNDIFKQYAIDPHGDNLHIYLPHERMFEEVGVIDTLHNVLKLNNNTSIPLNPESVKRVSSFVENNDMDAYLKQNGFYQHDSSTEDADDVVRRLSKVKTEKSFHNFAIHNRPQTSLNMTLFCSGIAEAQDLLNANAAQMYGKANIFKSDYIHPDLSFSDECTLASLDPTYKAAPQTYEFIKQYNEQLMLGHDPLKEPTMFYRGLGVSNDLAQQWIADKKITIPNIHSTTLNKNIAHEFCDTSLNKNANNKIRVRFDYMMPKGFHHFQYTDGFNGYAEIENTLPGGLSFRIVKVSENVVQFDPWDNSKANGVLRYVFHLEPIE